MIIINPQYALIYSLQILFVMLSISRKSRIPQSIPRYPFYFWKFTSKLNKNQRKMSVALELIFPLPQPLLSSLESDQHRIIHGDAYSRGALQ